MKKWMLFLMTAMLVGFTGCETDDPTPDNTPLPTISLEKGVTDAASLTFKATITNAEEAAYMVVAEGEETPALATILAEGELFDLRKESPIEIKVGGLEAETGYQVVAAAKNGSKSAGSNTLHMTTAERTKMTLSVELVQKDHEKINFRFTAANAESVHYMVMTTEYNAPEASYVVANGTEVAADLRESVEVAGLESSKEYQLLVVAAGNGETLMHQPLLFTTDDDPTLVINHPYTRAKGSCLMSGSAFVQLSYEDANEVDNFAYNDEWLGLDFRIEANQEYLPEGVYTVASDGAVGTLLDRYSNYGYDNGVQLDSGTVTVTILEGDEVDYYRFEVDVYLKNGRHLVAAYEGEVDGMPVKSTIFLNTNFTSASAEKKAADGSLWSLTLRDDNGNETTLDLYNAHKLNYLATCSYTASNAPEATNTDFEAGEFNGSTSTFKVAQGAGAGEHRYTTGTLHVETDFVNQLYLMSLYATLENGVVIEAEFLGAVEGISLAPSTESTEVTFTTASASSIDKGAYWNINLSNPEGWEARISAECTPSPDGLPADTYTAGLGAGHIALEGAYIVVPGERQYYMTGITMVVSTDYTTKSYTLDLTAKIEDGRTFHCLFEGVVEGMEVKAPVVLESQVSWATASASGWRDWWTLTLADANGDYTTALDLRSASEEMISAGTYEEKSSAYDPYAVMFNYCKVTAGDTEYKVKGAVVEVAYDEATQEYAITANLTLSNGHQFTGTYQGKVAGSPAVE